MVTYNKNAERPLLTDGWSSLRSFYGMTGDHVVCLRYVGDSTFQVNVFKKPSTPASFPTCHAKKERQLRRKEEPKSLPRTGNRENHCNLESSSFSITLTHYKATGSQLVRECSIPCLLMLLLQIQIIWILINIFNWSHYYFSSRICLLILLLFCGDLDFQSYYYVVLLELQPNAPFSAAMFQESQ